MNHRLARSGAGPLSPPTATLAVGWALVVAGLATAALATAEPAQPPLLEASPSGRYTEAVVVGGELLGSLRGLPVGRLGAWASGAGGWQRITVQVDERGPAGALVATEDGIVDANDEAIVLVADLGGRVQGEPPGPIGPLVEVRVADPIDAAFERFAYLGEAEPVAVPPVVTYGVAEAEIRAPSYALAFGRPAEDGFIGVRSLALFGGSTDWLDRSKLRATVEVSGTTLPVTEELVVLLGFAPEPAAVISGSLRVAMDAAGAGAGFPGRVSIGSPLGSLGGLPFPLGGTSPPARELPEARRPDPGPAQALPVRDLRVSFDWTRDASGATYRDAYTPGGVTVDGRNDAVPTAFVPRWRELRLPAGRLVFLTPSALSLSDAQGYYRDSLIPTFPDSGALGSFGEFGVSLPEPSLAALAALAFTVVPLPPTSTVGAERLVMELDHPLEVEAASPRVGPTPTPAPDTMPRLWVRGHVFDAVDAAHPSVVGARVTVEADSGVPVLGCDPPMRTDGEGRFSVLCRNAFGLGTVTVLVEADGYQSWRRQFPIRELSADPMEIGLARPGRVVYLPWQGR